MFAKITIVLLSISLGEVILGASISDEFTTNVATSATNLLGVNCMIESILDLEDAADDFTYEIRKKCRQANNLVKELADAKDLMKLTTNLIHINDEVCDNAGYDEEEDADTEPTSKCIQTLTSQMAKLYAAFTTTTNDINSGLQASYSKGACAKTALSNFKYILGTFGSRITNCAERAAQV